MKHALESCNRIPSVVRIELIYGLGEISSLFTEIFLKHLTILIDDKRQSP
jgi:hypothetical protein